MVRRIKALLKPLLIVVSFTLLPSVALAAPNTAITKEVTTTATAVATVRQKPFTLVLGKLRWQVSAVEIKKWYKTSSVGSEVRLQLRPGAIYDYLNVNVSPRVNNLGTNSRFLGNGNQIVLLSGGQKGQIVDGVKTSLAIRAALAAGHLEAKVALQEFRPPIFSVEDFKRLSFPDLLGRGESNFAGSPANRRHNIATAYQRFNGVVVLPGDTFSFNSYLGAVDAANGYLPELVIKENVTTPEFGGGICQVSTTAFRAALIAGLEVTERHNHSYPVAYYGKPGFDATVYQPRPDLKFKNDIGQPVLLKTSSVGNILSFEVWGKGDGRTVKINGPFVTEKKPDGSITAALAQIVTKGGKTLREQNFVSHYQSPDKFPHAKAVNGG